MTQCCDKYADDECREEDALNEITMDAAVVILTASYNFLQNNCSQKTPHDFGDAGSLCHILTKM